MIYPRRYLLEPRKRSAYCEACDLISVYGANRRHWRTQNLSRSEREEIWNTAETDMKGKSIYDFAYDKGSR